MKRTLIGAVAALVGATAAAPAAAQENRDIDWFGNWSTGTGESVDVGSSSGSETFTITDRYEGRSWEVDLPGLEVGRYTSDRFGRFNLDYEWRTPDAGFDDWYGESEKWFEAVDGAALPAGAARAGELLTLTGRLLSLRTVAFDFEADRRVLAKIRTPDDRTAVVHLGSLEDVRQKDLRFRREAPLEITGWPGRLSGEPILVTQRLVLNGQAVEMPTASGRAPQVSVPIDPADRPAQARVEGRDPVQVAREARDLERQREQERMARERERLEALRAERIDRDAVVVRPVPPTIPAGSISLQGEVTDMTDVQLEGLSERHRLAKLRTSDGRVVTVDLGPVRQLQNINLQKGEWAAVIGRPGRIDGREVVFATHVADIVAIDRSHMQYARPPRVDVDVFGTTR